MAECQDHKDPPSLGVLAKLKLSDWFKVGESLGFQELNLLKIEFDHSTRRNKLHACQVAMFGKWLKEHPSPSTQDVIKALRNAGEDRAADQLSQKYGEVPGHALALLSENKQKLSTLNIVASGPAKEGKRSVFKIIGDILKESWTAEIEKMHKNRSLLRQNLWIQYLSLFNYKLPDIMGYHYVDLSELPEVTEMVPTLLRGPMLHFVCFDLSQDMNMPVQVAVEHHQQISTPYTSWKTIKQFLYQVVETVTTYNWPWAMSDLQTMPTQHQSIAILGVHSGETQQVSYKVSRADYAIKEAVQTCGTNTVIRYCHRHEDRMIFSLDLNQSYDGTRVKEVTRQLMNRNNTINTLQLKTPAYELIVLLHERGGVLSFGECRNLARLCGVRDSDLPTVLKNARDKFGIIFYFPDIPKIKNLVICGSDEIITPIEEFTVLALNGTPEYPQDPSAVRDTGEIPLSLIDWIVYHDEPAEDKVTLSCIIDVLKYYKFLSEAEGANGTAFYFYPCLLRPHPSLNSQYDDDEQATISLLFCFKQGHSPHNLFTALVAQLARSWKLTHGTRYKNLVTFIVNNSSLAKVEIKNRGDYYQLRVLDELEDSREYSCIRQEIQRALHLIKVRHHHLSSEVCHIGFYCPHGSYYSPHCAIVRIVDGEMSLQCNSQFCRKERFYLEERMKMWFNGEHHLNEKTVDGFANLLADTSLSCDIDEEDIMQQIEAHIVEEGSIPLRVVRCGLFGAPRVGKTSSMRRLTNEIENLEEKEGKCPLPSTGIEVPITHSLYSTMQHAQLPVLIADQEWNRQDLDSQLQMILQCIITDDEGTPLPGLVTTLSPATGQTNTIPTLMPEAGSHLSAYPSQSSLSDTSPPSPFMSSAVPEATPQTTTDLVPPPSKNFDSRYIRNLIKKKSWKKMRNLLKEFKDVTLLNVVDTGGQPEYQDILPVLLGGSGLSLLFLNLTQDPEKPYPVVYCHADEGTQSMEYRSQLSTLQMLFQVLVTLTNTSTEQHAAILVGTHRDQLLVQNEIDTFERKVMNALRETEFLRKDVIKSFQAFGKERIVFPLDNMTGNKAEIKQLQGIISEVAEHFQQQLLPTSWLLFHLALRYLYEKEPGYCTIKQCKQLAARCGIHEKDVPVILSYFHKNFGTILYFPDVPCLRDIVICNPSIIFTAINSLVAESFTNNPFNLQTSHSICETGEIARVILDRICASDTAGGALPTHHIIELLKYHHLITEIQSTDHTEGMALFMPCLLHYCDEQETLEKLHELNPAPLFIHFSRGYIPNGFFTGYIIGLAEKWMLEPKRYKNRVSFVINKALMTQCTLALHYNHIQVQVQAQESNEVCIHIRQTLLSVVDAMRKKFAYLEGIKPQLCLLCPATIDSKYFATCLDTESPERMHCEACDSHDLLPKHKIWFSSFKKDDAEEPMCTEEIQPTASTPHTPSVSSIQKDSSHMGRKQTGSYISQQSTRANVDDAERMDVCDANNETVVASPKLSEVLTVQVDDLRSIEKAISADVAVQVDDLRSIEKTKLSVDVAVQVDDLGSIEKFSQHDLGRLAEVNYCDLEAIQTAEYKEEQQQMLKRIERAKDVQIFNLERKLIQKSHTTEANQELLQPINDENQQLQQKLATMLQISNAKDWQIAQLEYKLHSQLMMLSSQSDYQENSKEPQCYVSTIDSAVQADYLTIAPDFLRGVEVYGETVLEVVGEKPQKLEWPGYGFYIEVPERALPPGVTASVAVKIILSGQFMLPENSQLISPIYWISSTIKFEKEVAVNIQHCAVIRNGEHCSKFKFIIARCSQKELPYRFREREGLFNVHTQYAAIKLKQFSMIGETGPVDTEIRCIGFMYYKQRSLIPLIADFQFLVVMDHEVYLKKVKEEYCDWSLDNNCLEICLSDADIELDQQEQEVKSWQILPLTNPPKIIKNAVTKFEPGKTIPHCAFELQLLPGKEYQRLLHKVNLKGVAFPESFHIRYPQINEVASPQLTKADTSSGQLQVELIEVSKSPMVRTSNNAVNDKLSKLFQQLTVGDIRRLTNDLHEVFSAWYTLGMNLDVSLSSLDQIDHDCKECSMCMIKMLREWINSGTATLAQLVQALREPSINQNAVAKKIEENNQ